MSKTKHSKEENKDNKFILTYFYKKKDKDIRKAKHFKEDNKPKKIALNIFLILLLIIIIICVYNIINWRKNNKDTETLIGELSNAITINDKEKENTENKSYNVNFKQLKTANSDTVAWVKVKGTDVEYPIVKYTDNDFYLSHSFDKNLNGAGWIFADYRNKMDETDKNIIVYGHNRKDGSMFASLKNILNKSWYENEENRKVVFITEQGQFEYEVFTVYQVEKENYDTTINFNSNEHFIDYIQKAKSRSIYNFNVVVKNTDNILTLSTCANDNRYRVVLHAKLIK